LETRACFVIAPLGEPESATRTRTDKLMRHIIRPAAEACKYSPTLATEDERPGLIHNRIVRRIIDDALVIADLTDHNPNVFYELAIRHCYGKPFVQLIVVGQPLPFDISGVQTIRYDLSDPDSVAHARESLTRQIENVDAVGPPVETPVTVASRMNRAELPMRVSARIPGKRLFQHEGYYPIDLDRGNNPSLNRRIFVRALAHFTERANYDRLAAMDLVFLREDNRSDEIDVLEHGDLPLYEELLRAYDLAEFSISCRTENARIFENYIRIVNNIGDTLKGVHSEILLHNVRNPIRSIIAARNSEEVSGRKVGDPSTRFVVQYVKDQGRRLVQAMEGGSKVSYLKQFGRTKRVKASTIPLYHDQYGLIGILCVNIDIDAVNSLKDDALRTFFANYVSNSGITPDFEREMYSDSVADTP
jgi:predicted transcriptional regulator YheO